MCAHACFRVYARKCVIMCTYVYYASLCVCACECVCARMRVRTCARARVCVCVCVCTKPLAALRAHLQWPVPPQLPTAIRSRLLSFPGGYNGSAQQLIATAGGVMMKQLTARTTLYSPRRILSFLPMQHARRFNCRVFFTTKSVSLCVAEHVGRWVGGWVVCEGGGGGSGLPALLFEHFHQC